VRDLDLEIPLYPPFAKGEMNGRRVFQHSVRCFTIGLFDNNDFLIINRCPCLSLAHYSDGNCCFFFVASLKASRPIPAMLVSEDKRLDSRLRGNDNLEWIFVLHRRKRALFRIFVLVFAGIAIGGGGECEEDQL